MRCMPAAELRVLLLGIVTSSPMPAPEAPSRASAYLASETSGPASSSRPPPDAVPGEFDHPDGPSPSICWKDWAEASAGNLGEGRPIIGLEDLPSSPLRLAAGTATVLVNPLSRGPGTALRSALRRPAGPDGDSPRSERSAVSREDSAISAEMVLVRPHKGIQLVSFFASSAQANSVTVALGTPPLTRLPRAGEPAGGRRRWRRGGFSGP